MYNWEYKEVVGEVCVRTLNKYGADGWVYVTHRNIETDSFVDMSYTEITLKRKVDFSSEIHLLYNHAQLVADSPITDWAVLNNEIRYIAEKLKVISRGDV